VRAKPELAAADGGQTGVPGFGSFFGTSAAAPHAAGLAALAWSARPGLSASQVASIVTSATSPCAIPADCGAGFAFADRAVSGALASAALAATDWEHVMLARGGAWYESARCALYTLSADHTGVRATYPACDSAVSPATA